MANEVGSDDGVVWVELPEKGDGIKHLVRVGEGVLLWGSALEVLLGNAMEDAVAPSLPFLSTAAWSTDVARRGDVHSMPSGRPVASIPDEASRDEVWGWRRLGEQGMACVVRERRCNMVRGVRVQGVRGCSGLR